MTDFAASTRHLAQQLRWLASEVSELARDADPGALRAWARATPLAALIESADEVAVAATLAPAPAAPPPPSSWRDLHADAMTAVADILRGDGDAKDVLAAARIVIERVEGKVPQRLEVEAEGDLLSSVFWRYVSALHLVQGMAMEEAIRRAEQEPETVQAWGRRVGLLGAGREPAAREPAEDEQAAEVVG